MKRKRRPSWISKADIFNGFECMADTDILNNIKHKNNTTECKIFTC